MALESGTKFGPYEVVEQIGSGGMGEVWRARDTSLDRDVAVKVLPDTFAANADRVARFEQEAKTLAALNHSNIAQIFGLERSEGQTLIVMELISGPTLEDRLKDGPIPADEALNIAMQIADALEAAHGQGIVHRDLKPANIKLRPDGTVKVLDFGIAKALASDPIADMPAPVMTTPVTQVGVILGTAAYMSPEQARGKAVDQRTDIWAFGCLLYEMLTGQLAFSGEDVAVIMARIIANETDMSSLPAQISPAVSHTLKLCLEKDPGKRIADIRDVKLALRGRFETEIRFSGSGERQQPVWRRPLPVGAAALLLGVLATVTTTVVLSPPPEVRPLNRFSYVMPPEFAFRMQGENVLAVSPDGRHFILNTGAGLLLRSMDSLEARLIPGTEASSSSPFFSPDGQSIAYHVGGDDQLKRVGISGGAPIVIANDIPDNPQGGHWASNGMIYLALDRGIIVVPENGGTPETVVAAEGAERFNAPQLLPHGDTLLYTVDDAGNWDRGRIVALSLATGERTVLVEGGSSARYVPSGHLVYALGADLFGRAFDAESLTVSERIVPLVQGVSRAMSAFAGLANFDVTNDGTLIYLFGEQIQEVNQIVWVDRNGNRSDVAMPVCTCFDLALSPDESRVAYTSLETAGGNSADIWIWSFDVETQTRLTFEESFQVRPEWTADSRRIIYFSQSDGVAARAADGTGTIDALLEPIGETILPFGIDADGNVLITVGDDISLIDVAGDGAVTPLIAGQFSENAPAFSPDGRFIAYQSDESGTSEIYVRTYPDLEAGKWQVSSGGGWKPRWGADGTRLFYMGQTDMMEATVETDPTFRRLRQQPLFSLTGYMSRSNGIRNFDVAADNERFLMLTNTSVTGDVDQAQVVIVQNWIEELKRQIPVE